MFFVSTLRFSSLYFIHMICNFIDRLHSFSMGNIFLVIRLFSHTWCTLHTHRMLMWRCKHNSFRWWSFCVVNVAAAQLIYRCWCGFIHGLLHISGLYQFIDVIECGEHSRLLGISKTGTFFINIMAVLSILSCSRRSHILEESQNLNVIGRWLPQLVQFSVDKKSEKSSEKRHVSLWRRRLFRKWKILKILFSSAFVRKNQLKWMRCDYLIQKWKRWQREMCIKAKLQFHASIPSNFTVNTDSNNQIRLNTHTCSTHRRWHFQTK